MKCLPKLPPFIISDSNNFPLFSSIGAIIFSSGNPSTSCSTYITAPANLHNPRYLNIPESQLCCVKEKPSEGSDAPFNAPAVKLSDEGSNAPAVKHSQLCCVKEKSGEGSDAPPTLERSGSERQEERLTSPPSEEEGLGEEVEPSLMVKRDGVILERPLFRVREDGWFSKKAL